MICRSICHSASAFRNLCIQPQMNATLNRKFHLWQQLKLFHVAAVRNLENVGDKNLEKSYKPLKVWENITVEELAKAMNIDTSDITKYYSQLELSPKTRIKSFHLFDSLANKLGWKFQIIKNMNNKNDTRGENFASEQLSFKPENWIKRPPVVTIMGHVDHGKTTLLDSLRDSFITQQEFGGITQHIGAFSVEVKPGEKITFIDTPGHAAFTAMRERGAEITDIVVLVIAADDGIMQQTIESIKIAKAAQVRIIIAVNKIDKPSALSINDIKGKLLEEGIQVEDKGGDVQLVPISALKKINLDLLTEVILLEAELMNLRADPTGFVEGFIIESKMEKLGVVATLIIKKGTLKKEKILVAGTAHCRVRRMLDEYGNDYKEVLPSTPVQVSGWKELPTAGDKIIEVASEKQAKALIRENQNKEKIKKQKLDQEIIKKKLSQHQEEHRERKKIYKSFSSHKEKRKYFYEERQLWQQKQSHDEDLSPHFDIILKGDVYGSLEALHDILESYDKHDECKLSIIDSSVGDIKRNDLEMAEIFNATIYAFNVNVHRTLIDFVKGKNIDIRYYNVIYKLIDDIREELNLRILPLEKEKINGEAEVLENFWITHDRKKKKVPVAGSKCIQGQLLKDSLYKVLRKGEVIYDGKLVEMKHQKNAVKSISKGTECGLLLQSFPDTFIPGDIIVSYDIIKVKRDTSWNPGF